ncbi:hypothetical protein SAMN05660337_2005 [Maridesulfovibrio ferrireducens]|uniref:N-acetyltransferase domain-containing protein n=1 Tax=Maridesulfovibrio ferrireducens TaxID=246191 RepID=A0A1G9H4G3_9BACT|nr:hypothetical protein [Maridesulfovibrio ferrireducens]SDL07878.1 hypothetical protein SAMN05660337_2005 [Maridesulfovibrio ferrireducens]
MSRLPKGCSITLGVPTVSHIEFMAEEIRQSDRQDIEGLSADSSVFEVIMRDVEKSKLVYALYLGENPYAVFGVIPGAVSGTGTPWVVGTKNVDKNPLPFARASLSLLEMLQKEFLVFETFVCTQNRKSILWHRWCGFKFYDEKIKLGRDLYYRATRTAGTKLNKNGER